MNSDDAYRILMSTLTDQPFDPFPADLISLQVFSPLSRDLANLLSLEELDRLTQAVVSGQARQAFGPVLALLHEAANQARQNSREEQAIHYFKLVLLLSPTDHNVRAALAEYAEAHNDPALLLLVMKGAIDGVLANKSTYRTLLTKFCRAAFTIGDADDVERGWDVLRSIADAKTLQSVSRRLSRANDLARTSVGFEFGPALAAIRSLCEEDFLACLKPFQLPSADPDRIAARLIAAAAATANECGWGRAYQRAAGIFGQLLIFDDPVGDEIWVGAGLDPNALRALRRCVGEQGTTQLSAALSLFQDVPTAQQMVLTWQAAARAGYHRQILQLAASGQRSDRRYRAANDPLFNDVEAALASLSPARAQVDEASVWFFITWQEDVERLFRQISALYHEGNRYIISVGGLKAPPSIGQLSALLMFENCHIHYRPAVTWGGPKLLYHNLVEVLESFEKWSKNGSWIQVLCHRSFPLMSPEAIRQSLTQDFFDVFPSPQAPYAWRNEWPDDVADNVDRIFCDAMDDIFEIAESDKLQRLAGEHYKIMGCSFNFSIEPQLFSRDANASSHSYSISPFSGDMRWPSFGRLTSFIDVSSEIGTTYTRRMHPIVSSWVSSVVDRHVLVTGDPFLLMSRTFASTILTDKSCRELFAAMDLGFAPEMNFFDTVMASPQYQMKNQAGHVYHRNDSSAAASALDIPSASFASDMNKRMYMRKMIGAKSAEFIQNFSEKIASDSPIDKYFLAVTVNMTKVAGRETFPSLTQYILECLLDVRCVAQDFLGKYKHSFFIKPDGIVKSEEFDGDISWSFSGGVLNILWNSRIINYRKFTSDGISLVFVPDEVVSIENNWSIFLKFDLKDICGEGDFIVSILPDISLNLGQIEGEWLGSNSRIAAVLTSFDEQEILDYPVAVERKKGIIHEIRQVNGTDIVLASVNGFPSLLRTESRYVANGRCVTVMMAASAEDLDAWDEGYVGGGIVQLWKCDIIGRARVETLSDKLDVEFAPDSSVRDLSGATIGRWLAKPGGLWIFGIKGMRVCLATQFTNCEGIWRFSGWAQKNLKDLVTFSIRLGSVDKPENSRFPRRGGV